MAASEASAALDSAYQGLEEAAQNQIPAEMVPDFAQIRLGFAVLKQQLGMELSVDNKFDLALGEFRHGVPADQLGVVWQQRPDVAQAVSGVRAYAQTLSDRPEWNQLNNTYEATRQVGVAVERQLGPHADKVLADPRGKRAIKNRRRPGHAQDRRGRLGAQQSPRRCRRRADRCPARCGVAGERRQDRRFPG
ncbi:hypothetical protein [Nonomuraea dietziae]|uniref:hypothetical protein n=1 Tax=Nonomuraea dietziae TaxID=65515 RepID=UPI0031DFABF1